MVLCFGFQEPKITGIFKITCLANHIRDGFRKQQMTLVKPVYHRIDHSDDRNHISAHRPYDSSLKTSCGLL
jgi:hypothetical protein